MNSIEVPVVLYKFTSLNQAALLKLQIRVWLWLLFDFHDRIRPL